MRLTAWRQRQQQRGRFLYLTSYWSILVPATLTHTNTTLRIKTSSVCLGAGLRRSRSTPFFHIFVLFVCVFSTVCISVCVRGFVCLLFCMFVVSCVNECVYFGLFSSSLLLIFFCVFFTVLSVVFLFCVYVRCVFLFVSPCVCVC